MADVGYFYSMVLIKMLQSSTVTLIQRTIALFNNNDIFDRIVLYKNVISNGNKINW